MRQQPGSPEEMVMSGVEKAKLPWTNPADLLGNLPVVEMTAAGVAFAGLKETLQSWRGKSE